MGLENWHRRGQSPPFRRLLFTPGIGYFSIKTTVQVTAQTSKARRSVIKVTLLHHRNRPRPIRVIGRKLGAFQQEIGHLIIISRSILGGRNRPKGIASTVMRPFFVLETPAGPQQIHHVDRSASSPSFPPKGCLRRRLGFVEPTRS